MKTKATILAIIFAIYMQTLFAQVCSNPLNIIYGLNQNGDIVPINVNNGSVGSALTSSSDAGYPGSTSNANAIGLDIQSSTFYYFQNNSAATQKFVSFNTLTNKYTLLAASPISESVVKGCVTADGTGYYCIDGQGTLCYYKIAANSWTKIGANLQDQNSNGLTSTFTSLGSGDIAIDGVGRLWIVVSSSSHYGLYVLQAPLPTTATSPIILNQIIAPTTATPTSSPFGGIAYSASGQIYMSTVNDLYALQSNYSIKHIGSFSTSGVGADLTSCNYPLSVLQISWANFSAFLQNNNSVLLTWSLNQQVDIEGYNIERSRDGETWENIGHQVNEPGESNVAFSFTDASPNTGSNYYRIQSINLNGNNSYSLIKTMNISANNKVNIWPVPAKGTIKIRITGSSNIRGGNFRIFTPIGQMVSSGLLNGGINNVDINSILAGDYIVQVTLSNGATVSQKLVKL